MKRKAKTKVKIVRSVQVSVQNQVVKRTWLKKSGSAVHKPQHRPKNAHNDNAEADKSLECYRTQSEPESMGPKRDPNKSTPS